MNANDERERAGRWGEDFKRGRNDDDKRWDAGERELAEVCADPETRAAFIRVLSVAVALSETFNYTKNPDGDCHIANDWGVEAFGDDAYAIATLISSMADIIALRATIND